MNRELALKVWISFIWRFLIWYFLSRGLLEICLIVLSKDRHHPSRFLLGFSLIVDIGLLLFTSYVAVKGSLNANFQSGVADA